MQKPNFALKRPYLFTSLIVVTLVVIYFSAGATAAILKLPTINLYLIANLMLSVVAIVLLAYMNKRMTKEVNR